MRIGFLNNQIDNRGTGNAVFDYADYNEKILGNKSKIFTFPSAVGHDKDAILRFQKRFGSIYNINDLSDIDALYHIKSGHDDGFNLGNNIPYLVHSVFENHPHGDRYATISKWMGRRFNLPFVPHIIGLSEHGDNLRDYIGIPDSAIVFGRHGGPDTFDISWAWEAVKKVSDARSDVWFLFMNTNRPDIDLNNHVIFIEPSVNPVYKRAFINSCDAMIHARSRGETFGIAVGEFAFYGKPVITYAKSPELSHLEELGEWGIYYDDFEKLYSILRYFVPYRTPKLYTKYTPEKVMLKFKEVFLDGFDTWGKS